MTQMFLIVVFIFHVSQSFLYTIFIINVHVYDLMRDFAILTPDCKCTLTPDLNSQMGRMGSGYAPFFPLHCIFDMPLVSSFRVEISHALGLVLVL